ncbi:putative hydro-lyase [Pelagibius litoralis]|uniref:Putative hydro-lyase HBA54_18670 n=1 Tax=Pelagibius litoralis TaxID=374515 RepID=A0A967F045_9PROT|nr:putative hydro-lyase [Pelagibius litoralis]NIA70625.1 putative hydro-lyase [Pelagibius litoralis]
MNALEANLTTNAATDLSALSPQALRREIRSGHSPGPTAGYAPGFLQGNLAILPESYAADFLRYCMNNPKPCPLIGMSEAGSPLVPALGDDLDIRTDLPAYRVFSADGSYRSLVDLKEVWRDDLVTFVLGCSFSFEAAIERAGLPLRHLQAGRNVPMYVTTLETKAAGAFHGPLVVSMRAFKPAHAIQAVLLSDRFRLAHGAPVHIGDPAQIGIKDLMQPEFGDAPVLEPGDIPVFWACGVTPQAAIANAATDLAITHEPGCMLVTDIRTDAAEFVLGAAYFDATAGTTNAA